MHTDEAGEVSLEPEGTAVDTQKSCALECDRAFRDDW